jgi:hypothetical protein
MIKNVLTDIGGIGLYGIISVCLFFVVFTGSLIWTFGQRKSVLNSVSQLPLEDGSQDESRKGNLDHE